MKLCNLCIKTELTKDVHKKLKHGTRLFMPGTKGWDMVRDVYALGQKVGTWYMNVYAWGKKLGHAWGRNLKHCT